MAVAFDNLGTASSGANVTTLTTAAFVVGSAANRAAAALLSLGTDTTGVTASLGADPNMSVIAGTDGSSTTGTIILARITALTGSQTCTASWTTAQTVVLACYTASGVVQTEPIMNNGVFATGPSPFSQVVTSTNGDLTVTDSGFLAGSPDATTNQTLRYLVNTPAISAAGDTGPGTGTTTHTWTSAGSTFFLSGANFVQAAATATAGWQPRPIFPNAIRRPGSY